MNDNTSNDKMNSEPVINAIAPELSSSTDIKHDSKKLSCLEQLKLIGINMIFNNDHQKKNGTYFDQLNLSSYQTMKELMNENFNNNFFETLELATDIRIEYSCPKLSAYIVSMAIDYRNKHMQYQKELISAANTKRMKKLICACIFNPKDIWIQLETWEIVRHGFIAYKNNIINTRKHLKTRKQNMPRIIRSAWCYWLEKNLNDDMCKKYYKKAHIVDLINIVHCDPNLNKTIGKIMGFDELKGNTKVKIKGEKITNIGGPTWAAQLSQGKTSMEICSNVVFNKLSEQNVEENHESKSIFSTFSNFFSFGAKSETKMNNKIFPHKDVLKHIIDICTRAIDFDMQLITKLMEILVNTVPENKYDIFMYYNILLKIKNSTKISTHISDIAINGLQRCMNSRMNCARFDESILFLINDESQSQFSNNSVMSSILMCNFIDSKKQIGVLFNNKVIMYNINEQITNHVISCEQLLNHSRGEPSKGNELIEIPFKYNSIDNEHLKNNCGLNLFFETVFSSVSGNIDEVEKEVQKYYFNNIVIYSDKLIECRELIDSYHKIINAETNFFVITSDSNNVFNFPRYSVLPKQLCNENLISYIKTINTFWDSYEECR